MSSFEKHWQQSCDGRAKDSVSNFMNDYIKEHDVNSDLKLMPLWIQKMLNEIINKES